MTVAIPLFGWISSHFPRRQFLPYVYSFFIIMLVLFYFLLEAQVAHVYVARAFFIWASVFNLFVVSVFWSFMADLYSNPQARRLFGFIAAGGQYFLKYVVSHPAVSCAIPATTKVKHMKDNMVAGRGRLPTAKQRLQMYKYFETL